MRRRIKASSISALVRGTGSMVHLAAELLMKETGIKQTAASALQGRLQLDGHLLGGTIDALFVSSPVAVGQAKNKDLKMLAVTSRYRLQALPPNVPTVEESGVPGFDTTAWSSASMGPAWLAAELSVKSSARLWWKSRGDPDTQAKSSQDRVRAPRQGRGGVPGILPWRRQEVDGLCQRTRPEGAAMTKATGLSRCKLAIFRRE